MSKNMYFSVPLIIFFTPVVFCEDDNMKTLFSQDDFKCSLPDVTSIDDKLDISRFRSDFSKVSEVKFPGLIGPLNERLICKIKCIDGNWVGPLCSDSPGGRFQPILRECLYKNDHILLAISFKNSSIDKEAHFPHGSVITARCKHFGLYKMKGDSMLRCENGEWIPKFPECVPTTVVTNFTGDAPPTIQYAVASGSAVAGPSGELLVFPESTVRLACVSARALGDPEWSWTQASGRHVAEWSPEEGEQQTHYRITLRRVSARHSDRYTCAAPGRARATNTVHIKVVSVVCPAMNASAPRLRQFAQGARLGHAAHFSCQPGFRLVGAAVATCMGDGRWSAPPPTCVETRCAALAPAALPAHLALLEHNSSVGGRAVFRCAWGYRLVGAPGLECEQDGTWSGDTPHCTPIYCPEPAVPERARLLAAPRAGRHPVGGLLLYGCEEGYAVLGEASIVCTESGVWSHPPPFCLPPNEIRKTDTIYVENATLVHFEE